MKTKKFLYVLAITAIAIAHAAVTHAQSGGAFEIKKSVFSAGGGRATGGAFALDGTAGQSIAGATMQSPVVRLSTVSAIPKPSTFAVLRRLRWVIT